MKFDRIQCQRKDLLSVFDVRRKLKRVNSTRGLSMGDKMKERVVENLSGIKDKKIN